VWFKYFDVLTEKHAEWSTTSFRNDRPWVLLF
jgi:hypothetical protein